MLTKRHSLAANTSMITQGELFTWGQAKWGALGLGPEVQGGRAFVSTPTRVTFAERWQPRITAVAAGFRHTVALGEFSEEQAKINPWPESQDGISRRSSGEAVFAWGQNRAGQLGLGDLQERRLPHRCVLPSPVADIKWSGVAAGWNFSVLWSTGRGRRVLATGCNKHGQLAVDPVRLKRSADWIEVELPEHKQPQEQESIEENDLSSSSALPSSSASGSPLPSPPPPPAAAPESVDGQDCPIAGVSCGWSHCVVRTRGGRVFGWGRSTFGQLGPAPALASPPRSPASQQTPSPSSPPPPEARAAHSIRELLLPSGESVAAAACGSESTYLVSAGTRELWTAGWNEHGNLGWSTGAGEDRSKNSLEFRRCLPGFGLGAEGGWRVLQVCAGGASVFALATSAQRMLEVDDDELPQRKGPEAGVAADNAAGVQDVCK